MGIELGDKQMRMQFGEGSTPVVHGNRVVIVWDHQGRSFIVALDAQSGEEIWRAAREEIDSWATPLVVEHNGRQQVVTNGMNRLRSYDLESGKLVWESQGTTMNAIPSPVAADGLVFVTSGFRGNDLKAIRLAVKTDSTMDSTLLRRSSTARSSYAATATCTPSRVGRPQTSDVRPHSGEKFTSFNAEFCVIPTTAMLLLCKHMADT